MTDIIERLDNSEMFIDAIDDAIAEIKRLRRELTAVDETLGEFYCPVLDPETSEKQGSFYLDHGVHLMRKELERLQKDKKGVEL